MSDWLVFGLIGWLVGLLVGWLVGWLVDWWMGGWDGAPGTTLQDVRLSHQEVTQLIFSFREGGEEFGYG